MFLSWDLWKRILLTASILVTVIAFAAAIRPLADGKVGAVDALRFMGLAIVPMLQYALPFAAGFAATLTYHDFASDNEAMACSAGGISYKAMLGPAAFTGLALGLVIYALTTTAIPRFFSQIEQLIDVLSKPHQPIPSTGSAIRMLAFFSSRSTLRTWRRRSSTTALASASDFLVAACAAASASLVERSTSRARSL